MANIDYHEGYLKGFTDGYKRAMENSKDTPLGEKGNRLFTIDDIKKQKYIWFIENGKNKIKYEGIARVESCEKNGIFKDTFIIIFPLQSKRKVCPGLIVDLKENDDIEVYKFEIES